MPPVSTGPRLPAPRRRVARGGWRSHGGTCGASRQVVQLASCTVVRCRACRASAEQPEARRSTTAVRRRARESAILAATRDACSTSAACAEAQIEDIARAVGINRAIVYRHFTGKEELFALALVGYLDELARRAGRGRGDEQGAARRSSPRWSSAFVDYGVAHPAFVDCAHSLMRRTGTELFDEISEGAMLRLGRAIAACLAHAAARPSRPGRARATSRSRTRCCWPTPSTPPASAASSSPGSGSSSTRPSPGVPSRPDRRRAGEGAAAHLGPRDGPG